MALRCIKEFADKETLLSVYNVIVCPYFGFCCEETQTKRLQKLQKRAALIIMNVSNSADNSVALQVLCWKPLEKYKAKIMYKLFNKMGPKSLTNLFTY